MFVEAVPGTAVATVARMSAGIWAAASGAVAQINAVDIAANNVANAMTPGYRADRETFDQVLVDALDGNDATTSLRYVRTGTVTPDFAVGEIRQTGRSLDVALNGEGFFVVKTPRGERYTRAGNIQLRGDGTLVTQQGAHEYLGPAGRPLQVSPGAKSVTLARDGALLVDGEEAGRLKVVRFNNVDALKKEEHVLLRAEAAAGKPIETDTPVESEALELSNANAMKAMTGLTGATRTFEMLSRVIEAFSEADRKAANDLMGSN